MVSIWGTILDIMPTKWPIILGIACYLYLFILLIIFSCFYRCFDGLDEILGIIFILV